MKTVNLEGKDFRVIYNSSIVKIDDELSRQLKCCCCEQLKLSQVDLEDKMIVSDSIFLASQNSDCLTIGGHTSPKNWDPIYVEDIQKTKEITAIAYYRILGESKSSSDMVVQFYLLLDPNI